MDAVVSFKQKRKKCKGMYILGLWICFPYFDFSVFCLILVCVLSIWSYWFGWRFILFVLVYSWSAFFFIVPLIVYLCRDCCFCCLSSVLVSWSHSIVTEIPFIIFSEDSSKAKILYSTFQMPSLRTVKLSLSADETTFCTSYNSMALQ